MIKHKINWDKMVDKSIVVKSEKIFAAMKWDLSLIKEVKVKKAKKLPPDSSKVEQWLDKPPVEGSSPSPETILSPEESYIKHEKEVIAHALVVSEKHIPISDKIPLPIPYFETSLGKLYHSDCVPILKALPDDSVQMMFFSPPYNTDGKGKNKDMYKGYNDHLTDDQYFELLSNVLTESLRICKGTIFMNMNYMINNRRVLYPLLAKFSEYLRENIIWKKDRIQPPIANILGKRYEYIFVFTKDIKIEINNFRKNKAANYKAEFGSWISNLIELSIKTDPTKYSKINRAGFPLDLPKMFIDIYSQEGDVVMDPFMGMGTTALACELLNRKWIGSELLEHSCAIIKERLQESK